MSSFDRESLPPADATRIEWCHDAVQGVSRTFALSINLLDEPLSTYVCVGYLLCRIPDTVEDAAHIPGDEKARLLRAYDAALSGTDVSIDAFLSEVEPWVPADPSSPDDWAVVEQADDVFYAYRTLPPEVQSAMLGPIREMVRGMAKFTERYTEQQGLRLQTVTELEEYSYYVAGTVGHLITNLVGLWADEETERTLRDHAVEFGLLLQLVNIAKDVRVDYHEENNVYVPAEWLDEHGVPQDDLLAEAHREGAVKAVERTISRARRYVDDARAYLLALPAQRQSVRGAWALPFLLAVATLRELEANVEQSLDSGAVTVSKAEVVALLTEFTSGSSPDIEALQQHVETRPYTPSAQ